MTVFRRFANDDSGTTAVEYALLVGLITLAIVTAVQASGNGINAVLTRLADVFQ